MPRFGIDTDRRDLLAVLAAALVVRIGYLAVM